VGTVISADVYLSVCWPEQFLVNKHCSGTPAQIINIIYANHLYDVFGD